MKRVIRPITLTPGNVGILLKISLNTINELFFPIYLRSRGTCGNLLRAGDVRDFAVLRFVRHFEQIFGEKNAFRNFLKSIYHQQHKKLQ